MCVTNVYTDQYPDGKENEFHQITYCPYGTRGRHRPCQKLSTIENPVRKIQFGEPTTEYMMTAHQQGFPSDYGVLPEDPGAHITVVSQDSTATYVDARNYVADCKKIQRRARGTSTESERGTSSQRKARSL